MAKGQCVNYKKDCLSCAAAALFSYENLPNAQAAAFLLNGEGETVAGPLYTHKMTAAVPTLGKGRFYLVHHS